MKRKLKDVQEDSEEGNEKKLKAEENENDEEITLKEFDVKKFRHKLKTGNFFDDLKLFIKIALKTQDVIFDFINAGGKPLEVVETIKSHEEASLEILSNLYTALHLIIQSILKDDNQRSESTAQALKYLVNKNSVSIVRMLSSTKSSDKTTILKILTTALQVDREIGHEILKNISVFSKSGDGKSDLSIFEDTKEKKAKSGLLREAFVNFFMAFLLRDTDVVMCKKILQKRRLFEFFLQGLYQDNYETIKEVLSCLTKNVLISPGFSKPEKFRIFTDDAVKHLLKIYEWEGPTEDKNNVVNLAHHFLILLLANRKHGIAFKGLIENRQNIRQLQVIGIFKNVWMYEYPSQLVIEIVKVCPDLMQNLLNRLAIGLVPRVTQYWFMCANFTKKLITEIDPVEMSKLIGLLEAKKVSSNIIKLSISQFILQNVNENALIQQENLEIREICVSLLSIMLKQCCKFLEETSKIDTLKDFEKHRIRFDIINHLFTFYPHIDIILNSLYRSIIASKRKPSDENKQLIKSQLKNTLEILLLLIEVFPATIEKIPSVIDYLQTLRQIYEYQLSAVDEDSLEIEMKIVKIILSLQPNILSIESQFFERIFTTMVEVYCSSGECRDEARILLIRIIKNVAMFSTISDLEISIWLEALRSVKKGILKESTSGFVKVLKSKKNVNELSFKWSQKSVQVYDKNLFDMIRNESGQENQDSKTYNYQLSNALPLLLNMKSEKLNRIIEFVEISILLMYHLFPHMKKSFIGLLKQDNVELNTQILDYIKKKSLCEFEDLLIGYNDFLYRKFQIAAIEGSDFKEIPADAEKCQILIIQGIFCATKLASSDSLTEDKSQNLIKCLRKLFNQLRDFEKKKAKNFEKIDSKLEKSSANKVFEYDDGLTCDYLVTYIFEHNNGLLDGFDINNGTQLTKFIEDLVGIFKSTDNFNTKVRKYSSKIIQQFKELTSLNEAILGIIQEFPFEGTQYTQLMDSLLEKEVNETTLNAIKSCIDRITKIQTVPLPTEQLEKLEKIYVQAALNTPYDLNNFEQSFRSYLSIYPHAMADVSNKIFEIAFQEDLALSKSYLQLVIFLFAHKTVWDEIFTKNALKMKKEFLYPLLQIAFTKKAIKDDMLKPLYAEFKSGVIRAIEKPNKAAQIYRENVESSLQLIRHAMPMNECRDLATKKFKFESTGVFQVKMLHAIFVKAFEVDGEDRNEQFFFNFVNHWVSLFGLAEIKDYDEYLDVAAKWLEYCPAESGLKLYSENWNKLYTTCLKNGLKINEYSKMLVILGKIISAVTVEPKEVVTIFDMIFTHSNFFNLAFNVKSSMRKWKRNLFYLLNVLVQKNPEIAHEKHVPIYLSSYQATMSSCDQLILNLLRFYELRCGIDLNEYKPMLFGQGALAHFTSHEHDELKFVKNTSLDKMDGVYFKLLGLFESKIIENTLNNYPIKRQLAGVDVKDMNGLLVDDGNESVYDPGYFLPLFEMILTNSSFNFLSVAIKNDLLPLVMPGLSCEDENMRLLAAHILLKCREHTEGKKISKEIWVRFYDIMQFGLSEVKEGTASKEKNVKHFPRASSISTRLLAEFCRIIPNKFHPSYSVLSNYLVIKEKFEFSVIPELLVLFQSSESQHEEHRLFLLNTINSGIRDHLDFKVLNNTPFLKMILSCYACPLSNRKIDLLILKIIDKIVTCTGQSKFLIDKYGLSLWIFQISVGVEPFEYDIIEMIVTLIEHTFESAKLNDQIQKMLKESLLVLARKFTKTKLSVHCFVTILRIINELRQFPCISNEDLTLFMEIAKEFVPTEHIDRLMYLKSYPDAGKYVGLDETFGKIKEIDESTKNVVIQTRKFIIKCNNSARK